MGAIDYGPARHFPVTSGTELPRVPAVPVLMAIGAAAGIFSGLFGVGGGVLLVPLLMWWAGMDFLRASATSLGAILPIATVSVIPYLAFGQFSWWITLAVVTGSVLGARAGMWIRRRAKLIPLEISFAVFLLGAAALVVSFEPLRETSIQANLGSIAALVAIGGSAGLAAAVFGAGGGVFLVPLLFVAGVGDLVAKSVSLLALIPASVIPSVNHFRLGTTTLRQLFVVAGSGVVFAPFAALWAQNLSPVVSAVMISVLATTFAASVIVRVLIQLRRR